MDSVILIVDDSPIILSAMSKVLSPHYKIRVANSGQRALDVVKTSPKPELILLDVVMPEMDGLDVLKKLQDSNDTKNREQNSNSNDTNYNIKNSFCKKVAFRSL